MKTQEIMTANVITITPDKTVEDAAKLMLEKEIGGLPVVENGKVIGMITESDFIGKHVEVPHAVGSFKELLGQWFEGVSFEEIITDARKTKVREVMAETVVAVTPETPLTKTVQIMMNQDLNRLIVLNNGSLVGIIARRDILKAFDKVKMGQ